MSVTLPANVTLKPAQTMSVTLSPTPPAAVAFVQGGPRGPVGPSGAAGASQIFQFTDSATWTCAHNLGRLPVSILVMDADGNVRPFIPIANPDLNTTVLTPNPPLSGQVTIQ